MISVLAMRSSKLDEAEQQMRSGLRTKAHWNDYIAHTRRQIWGGQWLSWRIWLVTLLPYVLGAGAGWFIVPVLLDNGVESGRVGLAMAGVYGAVSAYLVTCLIAPRLQKPIVAEEGVFCATIVLRWSENDIAIESNGTTYTVPWSVLNRLTETNQTLFLQLEPYEAIVVPLSVFEDEADLAAFKEFAEARIAAI